MKTKFSKNKALETNIQIVWIELLQNFIYFNLPSTLICQAPYLPQLGCILNYSAQFISTRRQPPKTSD